jgi:hypothetical protein
LRARLFVYLVVACLVSALQFPFYDCSELPALSFGAVTLTILTGLIVIDRVYAIAVSPRPPAKRWAIGLAVGVPGGAMVLGLGWVAHFSHICP